MPLGRPLLLAPLTAVLAAVLATVGLPATAAAAAEATTLTINGQARHADEQTTIALDLRTASGPVPGATVQVDRRIDGAWRPQAVVTTDEDGRAELTATLSRAARENAFRATYAGDATYAAATAETVVRLVRRTSVVSIVGPGSVVDERSLTLQVRWRTGNGDPVAGRLQVTSRVGQGRWRPVRTVRTDDNGLARLTVRPRVDTQYRARALGTDWAAPDTSPVKRVDNRPPRAPVRLPAGAPRPRVHLPRQQRAVGEGANVVIRSIPDGVWRSMVGRSWHRGCPVGRSGLRLVRVNYWGYDGYRYRGELVAATGAAGQMAGALAEMYRRGFPIRSMYRVDRFGWSDRLQGADDYRSMAAGNTSAFNCRWVVGRPGVRSPHTYGRSLDVNTWENPYYSSHGVVPNGYWGRRSHPLVAWRSRSHPVVGIMARHGLRWTYGTSDSQHFDASRSGRAVPRGPVARPRAVHPQCGDGACR